MATRRRPPAARDKAPAHDSEIEEALEEGVMIKWLSTIKHADAGAITIEKMVLDDKGFPQPTGEYETLAADSVVLALGQDVGGHVLMADLAALPHMLIAGATGQGKTVCMNSASVSSAVLPRPAVVRR